MTRPFKFSLKEYYLSDKIHYSSEKLAVANNFLYSQGMLANAYFFGHPIWAKRDFQRETHNRFWKSRWQQVIKSWDDKVVVDIGCGFGHVLETISGNPALIIGVDISLEALKHDEKLGYWPMPKICHLSPVLQILSRSTPPYTIVMMLLAPSKKLPV